MWGQVFCPGRVIIVNIEAQGFVIAHLAFEISIVGKELADEVSLECEMEYVTPKVQGGFVLKAVEFAFYRFFVCQSDADCQVVVEFVFGNDVPVKGTAYLFYRAVVGTEEVEHAVLFLYDQELAGHF